MAFSTFSMSYVDLARTIASSHSLDSILVCALVEQESGWDNWAVRFEPAFEEKYVRAMKLVPTEDMTRSMSFGLMQLMGEVARELGFTGKFLTELCDPQTGLEYGCRHFANKLKGANGDVNLALLHWNGGANLNYPAEVLARKIRY